MNRRILRLELVAGLGIALAMPALAAGVGVATITTLSAGTLSGCSQPLTVNVTANGQPVTSGTVTINDEFNGKAVSLASMALSSAGAASPTVSLAEGSHSLTAVFSGITGYATSTSTPAVAVSVATQCEFTVTTSNFLGGTSTSSSLILTPGDAGTVTVSITPSLEFTSTLTQPMLVTISCAGLPDEASCSFTPQSPEILSTTTEPLTSTMIVQTLAASTTSALPAKRNSSSIAWALLLPGALGLGGFAWGSRGRRRWLSRLSLVALIGLVTLLGTTGCNPRYAYEHHGPPPNPATPAGTYTITVTAQSNNGVNAVSNSTTFALTVN
ncbi:MAG: Ig-like domain-containing protein [Terracidiphilus sp.]